MQNQNFKLIQKARQYQFSEPFDQAHELTHHYKVWEIALQIMAHEGLWDQVDRDLLYSAIWWHDLDRTEKTHQTLRTEAAQSGVAEDQIDKIISLINTHSYHDDRSSSLESKLLFDADKVEYIGIGRWEYIQILVEHHQMTEVIAAKYCEAINTRIEKVANSLNFNYSKFLFSSYLEVMIRYLKAQKEGSLYRKYIDIPLLERLSL